MNWRWLLFDFIDPNLPLDRRERRAVEKRARSMKRRFRSGLHPRDLAELFLPLATAAGMLGLVWIVVPTRWVAGSSCLGLIAIMVLATWLVHAWLGKWLWRPWVYAALRAEGYDVCGQCGYWLRGLGDDVTKCPECGAKRDPMLRISVDEQVQR